MTDEKKTERLTVDLEKDEKQQLRVITAMHGEKHMQTMVRRLIREAYQRMNVASISAAHPKKPPMNFNDEEARNLRA